ncbi:MAG: hypothetical protein JO114_05820 [Planctomycetaceae bacterium]|nr:hypothetical protein [Planctomycetaceae bacterium]
MVYRETPRIAAKDGRLDGVIDDADSRPRLRRFDFVRSERQFDLPRVLLASGLFVAGVVLIGYLGTQALRTMIRWLYQQPQYQVKFLDIRLQNEPPAWFRGGAQAFLRQVREHRKEAEVLPVLELETERIDRDFRLFPWVDDVTRVEYPPQGITVHLVYKQPVATIIPFPSGEHVILDRNGHILPGEDIDTEKLGPLIRITGKGLDQPATENRPGTAWKSSTPGAEGPRLERCVLGAARLAGFLQEPDRAGEAASVPALRVLAIFATDRRGLFVQNVEGVWIYWGEAPGSEASGNLAAKEKWEMLKKWATTPSRRILPSRDYWRFSRTGLEPVKTAPAR